MVRTYSILSRRCVPLFEKKTRKIKHKNMWYEIIVKYRNGDKWRTVTNQLKHLLATIAKLTEGKNDIGIEINKIEE